MPGRTTPAGVKEILETDLTDAIIDAFISGATQLLNTKLADKGLSDDLMEEIERWLTAHMIASTRERQAISEKAGPAEQEFTDVYDRGLDSTSYGQMAMTLDPTGTLYDLSEQRRPIRIHAIKSR